MKTTKNIAAAAVAAALASALTIGTTAAPALADTSDHTLGQVIYSTRCNGSAIEDWQALDIAQDFCGIPNWAFDSAEEELFYHEDHGLCWQVMVHTNDAWAGPYSAYSVVLDACTGEVYFVKAY